MRLPRLHATGRTLLFVIGLTVGLSLLPLPGCLRPFPELRSSPRETLLALALPGSDVGVPSGPLPDAASRASGGLPALPPIEDEGGRSSISASEALATASGPRSDPGPPVGEIAGGVGEAPGSGRVGGLGVAPLDTLPDAVRAEARRLDALAVRLGATPVVVEQGCKERDASGSCVRGGLDPFFDALAQLERARSTAAARETSDVVRDGLPGPEMVGFEAVKGAATVRVVHFGDSQLASDHITDVVRARLKARHGDGGRGFLFVERPTPGAGRRVRTGHGDGWSVSRITDGEPRGPFALSGTAFRAEEGSASARFEVRGSRRMELFHFSSTGAGSLEVHAGGRSLLALSTTSERVEHRVVALTLPEGIETATVIARGAAQLDGVVLEREDDGVVYDAIGLPGTYAKVLLRPDEAAFTRALESRSPALLAIMLGGNEGYRIHRGWTTAEAERPHFERLLERLRAAAPDAACLLFSPLDAGLRKMGGAVTPRPGTTEMAELIRSVAAAQGCAFLDLHRAMGGEGAIARWYAAGLIHEDLVHPKGRGGDVLGHLIDLSLADAHARWRAAAQVSATLSAPVAEPDVDPAAEPARGPADAPDAELSVIGTR